MYAILHTVYVEAVKYVSICRIPDDIPPLRGIRYYSSTQEMLPLIVKMLHDRTYVWNFYNIREFLRANYKEKNNKQ